METKIEAKKFTLTVKCYGKYLSSIENGDTQDVISFAENYKEPFPTNTIRTALLELKSGETEYIDWHTNNSKLLGMIPEYHRDIFLKRLC
jgi:hypothetical protein